MAAVEHRHVARLVRSAQETPPVRHGQTRYHGLQHFVVGVVCKIIRYRSCCKNRASITDQQKRSASFARLFVARLSTSGGSLSKSHYLASNGRTLKYTVPCRVTFNRLYSVFIQFAESGSPLFVTLIADGRRDVQSLLACR
jgi:hypothetical protein